MKDVQDIGKKMVEEKVNLATSYVLGNIAFKSYDSLMIKYGTDVKKLESVKNFDGKEGFVKLEKLTPNTKYFYSISSANQTIGTGDFQTAAK